MTRDSQITAAIIGGIVTVLVALIGIVPLLIDDDDKSSNTEAPSSNVVVNSTGGSDSKGNAIATVATRQMATAPGRPGDRPIRARNACDRPLNVWIAHRGPDGWDSSGGDSWQFQPGQDRYVARDGVTVRSNADQLYVNATLPDGTAIISGDVSKAGLIQLREHRMTVNTAGDYVLTLECR